VYPNREVFPNSPLALVAAEVRYTDAVRLREQGTRDRVALALADRFPFPRSVPEVSFQIVIGGDQTRQTPQAGEPSVLVDADGTASLTVTTSALIYETTAYDDFGKLVDAVTAGCDALSAEGIRPAVQRVGIRYVDEIRVTDQITDVAQWADWVDPRLVQQVSVGPQHAVPLNAQGVVVYSIGDQKGLVLRYAALNQTPVVSPPVLRRIKHGSGPFFVLDFDAFEDFTDRAHVPLNSEVVTASLTEVHASAGEAFQNAITDRARDQFRGVYS
jgi:uncharacterized protein (TIGR04255 family)